MGIPSYFVHIVKNHRNVIKIFKKNNIKIDNLYLDSNSIIYDELRTIVYKNDESFEKKLITQVCEKVLYYIKLINPLQRVLVAFDGVAPVAKLEQQRNRRYKTSYVNNYIMNDAKDTKDTKDANDANVENMIKPIGWDTTAITPGTAFMETLYKEIKEYFSKNANSIGLGLEPNLQIMISGSNDCGEGEHKIYSYIRDNRRYHYDTNTVIYGLDADLIMLTLIHTKISENLYLFRETPHFITSIDRNLVPEAHYVLDIYELGEKLNLEMSYCKDIKNKDIKNKDINNKPIKDCIYDYIFLCFFLGNDFMPHFPALNIRTNGISILIETYNNLFGNTDLVLIDNNKIHWKNLRRFVEELAKCEALYLAEEMKTRERHERNTKNKRFATAEERLMAIPLLDRTVERYINIGEDGWQERYYQELFGIEINDERKKQICLNYLEGLEWNFKYYTKDCPDWKWKYNYKYPPLLEDLCRFIPYFDTEFIQVKPRNPVQPLVQLAYVLPRNSLNLLPQQIRDRLLIKHPEWYKLDYDILWAYCKYFWESHIVLPHIKIEELERIIVDKELK